MQLDLFDDKKVNDNSTFYDRNKDIIKRINMSFVIRVYIIEGNVRYRKLVGAGMILKYINESDALIQFKECLKGRKEKLHGGTEKTLQLNLKQNRTKQNNDNERLNKL